MQKIFNYIVIIISISSCSLLANAQEKTDSIELYRGIRAEVDLFSPLMTSLGVSKGYYYQGAVAVNLKEKYFPTIEIGVGGINNKESVTAQLYSTNAMYARIGLDYNLIGAKANKNAMNNIFVVGVRLGGSQFNYDLRNVVVSDDYWGNQKVYNYENVKVFRLWYEILAGIRVEIFDNIFMGWNIRLKYQFNENTNSAIYPYYIPGFGTFKGSNYEFNYSIGYQF